ncbi:glycoside hydrolase [Apiospora rasikravindrae]|uniref:chitinase n=1 Tax=Apiospora rasikravindrae TaxID=990691 RepID=A0ABR1SN04_9PEZI
MMFVAHWFLCCCVLLLIDIDFTIATFSAAAKTNVAVYYGQGPNQKPLSVYCADDSIDIIILSFVHLFPQQANGYPGIDFGNQCYAETFPGPGYQGKNTPSNNRLLKCPNLQRDLYTCRQTSTKKILLSLGGGTGGYQLTGASDGSSFATQLWSMFGPRQDAWVQRGFPRPFDYNGIGFSVDGFDLDVEHPSTDASAGYKALVTKLRSLYTTVPGTFYLTASPQCIVPDANMKDMLTATTFDMIFIQYYNTPQCSGRRWANANPGYQPGNTFDVAGFTYDSWSNWLAGTYSKNARLYIGLPGSAAAANPGNDLSVAQASNIANAYYCRSNFGGMAIWEATYASANVAGGRNFYQNLKVALNAASKDPRQRCSRNSTTSYVFSPPRSLLVHSHNVFSPSIIARRHPRQHWRQHWSPFFASSPGGARTAIRRRAAADQKEKIANARPSSTRAAGAGGSSSTMLRLYTDESPGLKVDPVVVLVLSLVFIFSVVALHIIAKVTRRFSS